MSKIDFSKLFDIIKHSYAIIIVMNVLEYINLVCYEKY